MFQIFAMGEKCFPGVGDEDKQDRTLNSPPRLSAISEHWGKRCSDLPPLLEAMLCKTASDRPLAAACMADIFFQKRVRNDGAECEEPLSSEVLSALGALRNRSKLQRAILADIAASQNLSQLKLLYDAFVAMDADHDGVVTTEEARLALNRQMEQADTESIIQSLVGAEGKLSFTSFMGELIASTAADENRILWKEFQHLDCDGTGYLDKEEVAQLLQRPAVMQAAGKYDISEIMEMMDVDKDGHIVFEEFRRALT